MMGEVPAPETSLDINNQDNGQCPNNNINYDPPLSQTFTNSLKSQYGPGILNKFRQYEKKSLKLAKEENHLTFLCKAREEKVLPNGLTLKPPYTSKRALKIMEKASWALLKDTIKHHRFRKSILNNEISTLKNELKDILSDVDMERVQEIVKAHYRREFDKRRTAQKGKLRKLIDNKNKSISDGTSLRAVKNLSSRPLTTDEEAVLNKGLNYAVIPKDPPKVDIALAVEEACMAVPQEDATELRWRVRAALEKARKPEPNLGKSELKALKTLKNEATIVILPADKGNMTVVLDKQDYEGKLTTLVESETYVKLKKDPTASIERKIGQILKKYEKELKENVRRKLKPNNSKPPHIYGLPKIHKEGTPLRPIVSSINSPCYALSRFLLDIVSPLSGKTSSAVVNSGDFVRQIKDLDIRPEDKLVSFDVVSLFTNVPVDEALEVVKNRLEADTSLKERSNLSIEAIMELLTVCLKTTYFQYKADFYQQLDGMAMGSPLSPVISNIYMEYFEDMAIHASNNKPKFWRRYVDDTFVIWEHGDSRLNGFLEHLNSLRPCIQFTMETEVNGSLPFLDVLVNRNGNKIVTSVYRKPTHTGRYLNYKSNHPTSTKTGIVACLHQRAKTICSDKKLLKEEESNLVKTMKSNGYPMKVITAAMTEKPPKDDPTEPDHKASIVIPYYKGLSEKIRRIGRNFKVRTAFSSQSTLRKTLSKTKPKNDGQATKDCVYEIPCECGRKYVGETGRPLHIRIGEHKRNVRNEDTERSRIAEHVWSEEHRIQWDEAKILHKESKPRRRKLKESAFMAISHDPLSRPSVEINSIWVPMLKQILK